MNSFMREILPPGSVEFDKEVVVLREFLVEVIVSENKYSFINIDCENGVQR